MNTPMMKCGHAANATTGGGLPCCAICIGLTPGAYIVDSETVNLEGRLAQCGYCGKKKESNTNLAFFEYRPNEAYDKYYCGCKGWE